MNKSTLEKEITDRTTFRLHTASRLIQQLSLTQLKSLDLTQAQWRALSGICSQPGATLQHLTAFAQISQPLMSQAVKALEKRELVTRKTPQNDRRSSVIEATDLGLSVYKQAFEAMLTVEETIVSILGKEQSEQFKNLLDTIIKGLE